MKDFMMGLAVMDKFVIAFDDAQQTIEAELTRAIGAKEATPYIRGLEYRKRQLAAMRHAMSHMRAP